MVSAYCTSTWISSLMAAQIYTAESTLTKQIQNLYLMHKMWITSAVLRQRLENGVARLFLLLYRYLYLLFTCLSIEILSFKSLSALFFPHLTSGSIKPNFQQYPFWPLKCSNLIQIRYEAVLGA